MERTGPRSIVVIALCLLAACTRAHRPAATTSSPAPSSPPSTATPSQPSKSTIAPSLPTGFVVVDSSWVSDNVGWVLGGRGCERPSCGELVRTNDGGAHWRKVSMPNAYVTAKGQGPQRGCPPVACISKIRFANSLIGYTFGSALFMTTDGGHTWRRQAAADLVDSLEISRGLVVRVLYTMSGCPGPCDARIESSRAGSTIWHRLSLPNQGGDAVTTAVEGSRIYVSRYGNPAGGAGSAHASFARSLDEGKSWSHFDDPCGSSPQGENDAIDFATAPAGTLVVLCQPRQGDSAASFVLESNNAGATFRRLHTLPLESNESGLHVSAGSSRAIAVLFTEGSSQGVVISRDGGSTWMRSLVVALSPNAGELTGFLGFQDARTARAAFGTAYIWTTRDAGVTWRRSAPFAS